MSIIHESSGSVSAPDALGLTRRGHIGAMMSGFLLYALLGEARAAPPSRRLSPGRWVDRQQELAQALASGQLRPVNWCTEVERLAAEVDVGELMAVVGRSRLNAGGVGGTNDPQKRSVVFLDDANAPRRLNYATALFAFQPHNVITPHGHQNMVSAHMVVEGRLRIRNFDRVRDEAGSMVVRPTRDHLAALGEVSTMCSQRNNIHWFVPQGGPATTFDVIISGLDRHAPPYTIEAIDPLGGRRLSDGLIAAPIIGFDEASQKYTSAL
ncbi:hypothetical protein [Stigmatella aurantiaca]|uniref:Uncharacterized protein n=1 Tax=Stigmatella aurantiaca (strain DW4/3-1) TaxID=378806 RepID=Q08WX2_STIAD|nr:hypothetical protein [Stigmatella aurantiaca]ADO70880.1 uncharacterized protein STAUR_3088 [Stigmatella aurantiaca DW4/3-1]EAU64959.1 hypothetical protein STIAU_4409 [Stigmatella aurantiaca DW4/3-1]